MTLIVCNQCGHVGRAIRKKPGSLLIEMLLWSTFFLPGLVYSLWRMLDKRTVCAACDSRDVIKADSPEGEDKMVQDFTDRVMKKLK